MPKYRQLIRGVKELGKQYHFHAVCDGHAGDGNLHISIRKEGVANSMDDPEVLAGIGALFEPVH